MTTQTAGTYDRVIVPVNGFPPNDRAIRVAEALAGQFEGDIEFSSMLYNAEHRTERSHLLHLLTLRTKRKAAFTNIHEGGDASAYILDLIARPQGLVVLAGATSVLGIPGSITADVVRFASRPVVIVGPHIFPTWQGGVERIVVPLDGSPAAEQALPIAQCWSKALRIPIELVQVIDSDDVALMHRRDPDAIEASYLEHLYESFQGDGVDLISFDVLHGSGSQRVEVICEYAQRVSGSMICMATNGSHLSRSMLSGTTLKVLHHSPVPALIVRS